MGQKTLCCAKLRYLHKLNGVMKMWKPTFYMVKNNKGQFLQGIKINDNYCRTGTAPTMGNRHIPSEYNTVWGDDPKSFEPLTLTSYIKILLEEHSSGDVRAEAISILPIVY